MPIYINMFSITILANGIVFNNIMYPTQSAQVPKKISMVTTKNDRSLSLRMLKLADMNV